MDDFLKAGKTFDWISPAAAITRELLGGPSHTFLIPVNCGWSGREIVRFLKKRGIKSWGHMIINNTITISVSKKQAVRAQVILSSMGIST